LFSKCSIHRNILPTFFDPFTSSKKCHNLTWNILLAAESLASEIGRDHLEKRQLFPAFTEIRDISAHIGAAVAEKAYELGTYLMRLYWQLSKFLWWLLLTNFFAIGTISSSEVCVKFVLICKDLVQH
jgi:hypothetical protein